VQKVRYRQNRRVSNVSGVNCPNTKGWGAIGAKSFRLGFNLQNISKLNLIFILLTIAPPLHRAYEFTLTYLTSTISIKEKIKYQSQK